MWTSTVAAWGWGEAALGGMTGYDDSGLRWSLRFQTTQTCHLNKQRVHAHGLEYSNYPSTGTGMLYTFSVLYLNSVLC